MDNDAYQLNTHSNLWCEMGNIQIIDFIGSGAQAEVYRVEINGKDYALKYYFKGNCSDGLKSNLKYIINNPITTTSFIWPLCFVDNGDQFGYIMDLKPKGFCDITDWLGGRVDTTMDILIKVCINLCDAFHDLHANGYSYKDISNSNITFNPTNGNILILDNDNITPNLKSAGVKGTNGFMAPELISGLVNTPSRLTDLFSLAVLLFQLLCCEHPLNGKKEYHINIAEEDESEIVEKLYGINSACFIFKDPDDLDKYIETSEPAHVQAKQMWKLYPKFIQDKFYQAFVDGIRDPHARPLSNEWVDEFIKLLGHLYVCPKCNYPHFFNKKEFYTNNGKSVCKNCGSMIALPIIRLDSDSYIVVNDEKNLYMGYFNILGDKLQTIVVAEYKDSYLSFTNYSKSDISLNSIIARPGEKTIKISAYDKLVASGQAVLTINNKDYMIAIPK